MRLPKILVLTHRRWAFRRRLPFKRVIVYVVHAQDSHTCKVLADCLYPLALRYQRDWPHDTSATRQVQCPRPPAARARPRVRACVVLLCQAVPRRARARARCNRNACKVGDSSGKAALGRPSAYNTCAVSC